jgi:hypothetical protein
MTQKNMETRFSPFVDFHPALAGTPSNRPLDTCYTRCLRAGAHIAVLKKSFI